MGQARPPNTMPFCRLRGKSQLGAVLSHCAALGVAQCLALAVLNPELPACPFIWLGHFL